MRLQPLEIIAKTIQASRGAYRRGNLPDELFADGVLRDLRVHGWHLISDPDLFREEEPGSSRWDRPTEPWEAENDVVLSTRIQLDDQVIDLKGVIKGTVRRVAKITELERYERTRIGVEITKTIGERLGLFSSAPAATVAARP